MQITAQMVKELRERTGAGMMDCKKALMEASGSLDGAIDALRKKGVASAEKKAGRVAAEGLVSSYIHAGGRIGVLVEVNCETDFVARTDEFQDLVKDIAMHIAAADPSFVRREEVSSDILEREREIYRDQALASGKSEAIVGRIVEGKLEKFFQGAVLMEQAFVKDSDKSVGQLVAETVAKLGENIQIRQFSRFRLGEGIEKRVENFAAEVREQVS